MTDPCPACRGTRVLPVADHYAAQVRRRDADPAEAAPYAPPLARALWPGTCALFLFFMAALGPGFVGPDRALTTGLGFALPGFLALWFWARARKADRARQAEYLKGRYCPDCGRRFL